MPFQILGTAILALLAGYATYRLIQWGLKKDPMDAVDQEIMGQNAQQAADDKAERELSTKQTEETDSQKEEEGTQTNE